MTDKQKRFLVMRADGVSFNKIAQELNTSKSTLIQWSKLFEDQIRDLQFLSLVEIKEQYLYSKTVRYKKLLQHLQKIDDAIENLDFSTVSLKDLMVIRNDLNTQLSNMEYYAVSDTNVVETDRHTGEKKELKIKLKDIA